MKLKKIKIKDRQLTKCPKSHHELREVFEIFSRYTIHIVFTDTISQSLQYLADRENFNLPKIDDTAAACHINASGRSEGYIVFGPETSVGSIAHECWHAIRHMFKWLGIELENETVAYHLGYLVDKVCDFNLELDKRTQRTQITKPGRVK